jgi:hypothetical protein
VRANPNPAFKEHEARVTVVTADGRRLAAYVPYHQGTPENPVGDGALLAKCAGLCDLTLPPGRAEAIAPVVRAFDGEPDPSRLIALCRP